MAQLQRLAIAPDQMQNQQITLTIDQQHYLTRVLRLQAGDRFIVIDAQGQWWLAALKLNRNQAAVLKPILVETELPLSITLIAALPKGNGFDEVVRQVTELGVTRIAPVLSDRTLLKPSPRKLERWRRIAQEAAEQSQRQIVPEVLNPLSFAQSLQIVHQIHGYPPLQRYLCVTHPTAPLLLHCLQSTSLSGISILTGPEGGWTEAEIEQAITSGYQPVSLGCRILRAVTAPVAALALISAAVELNQQTLSKRI